MGQRSQIYIRYKTENKNYLIAKYYQWNYAERMISRCRYTLEWIQERLDSPWYFTDNHIVLQRYVDVNFDMQDIQIGQDIIKRYNDDSFWRDNNISFNEMCFFYQANNDGKLFIDICDHAIKYAFLDFDCDTDKIMSAARYMNWDNRGWRNNKTLDAEEKKLCEKNIRRIQKIATLMTKEELEEFIGADYMNRNGGICNEI